jgi:hypothetical protein
MSLHEIGVVTECATTLPKGFAVVVRVVLPLDTNPLNKVFQGVQFFTSAAINDWR